MPSGPTRRSGSSDDSGEIQALLGRLDGKDQEPLAELFSHYRERLWRMVFYRLDQRLRGRVSPSDVLQEAYIDAADRVPHYLSRQSEMSFFVWLRLIVKQRLITVHRQHLGARKRDARQEVRGDARNGNDETAVSLVANLAASLTSPSQMLARAEMLEKLEEVLHAMEPIDREILALRHLEELTNDEAAEVLGLKKAAASNRYVRALRRLREALARLPGFAPDQED